MRRLTMLCLIALSFTAPFCPAAFSDSKLQDQSPTSPRNWCADRPACGVSAEVFWEDILSYREHCARLKTLIAPVRPHSEGTFEVKVDSAGVARLQPVYLPPKAKNTNGDADLTTVPGCYMPDGKWARLSLSTVKELFGSPRKHTIYGDEIYIFDARGIWGDEENIYHIDLVFDSEEVVSAYRVRGIGISMPLWIKNGKTSILP